jgi:AcrR family transcriptional regulator
MPIREPLFRSGINYPAVVTRPSYAERRKLALREEIIDAAIEVFAESGYHDAGVADIARRVGIGHSTFYRHFDNKRAILDEVINTVIQRATAVLAAENAPEAASTLDDYRDQVGRIAAALAEISSDLRVVRLILIEAASIDTDMRQRIDGMFDLAVRLTASYYEHGLESGYLRADLDTTATARAVVGMIFGLAMIGLNPDLGQDDRTRSVQAATRLMFDGIVNHHNRGPGE